MGKYLFISFVLHVIFIFLFMVEIEKIYPIELKQFKDKEKEVIFVLENIAKEDKKPDNTNVFSSVNSPGKGKITKKKGHNWEEKLEVRFNPYGSRTKSFSSFSFNKGKNSKKIGKSDIIERKLNIEKFYNTSLLKIPDNFNPDYAIALNFSDAKFSSIRSFKLPMDIFKEELKMREDIMKYIRRTIPKILDNLNFPIAFYLGAYPSGILKVLTMLDRDGNVLDVRVIQTFGFKSFDESVVAAIRDAKNFGPLPKSYRYKRLYIVYVIPHRNLDF